MQDMKFPDIYFHTTVCLQKQLLISVLQHSSKRVCDKFKKLGSLLYIMTNETNNCTVCGKDADKKCSRCKEVAYCSKECQAISWKTHKNDCNVKFTIDNVTILGSTARGEKYLLTLEALF